MKYKVMGLVALALVVVGCTNAKAMSQEEAEKKALAIQNGEVTRVESDLEDDDPSYTFTIKTDTKVYEIEIDANDGKMISQDMKAINNATDAQITEHEHAINEEQARKIAMDKVPDATIVKFEFDHDGDDYDDDDDFDDVGCHYEVELKNGNKEYKLDIDAQSGAIISYEEDLD